MEMNCETFSARLSEYLDSESDAALNDQMLLHIESCESCQNKLHSFQRIGEWMREVEVTVDTEAIWNRISPVLPARRRTADRLSLKWILSGLSVAASLVFLITCVDWNPSNGKHGENQLSHDHATFDHDSLAVDFRQVIELAQIDPQQAIASLIDKYDGKELDAQEATQTIGYLPSLFSKIPVGFERVSTHVLKMPCCKCSATICQRKDGKSLIVFEHKDEQPVWFGELPSIETQCSGTQCRIIESSGELAVSWKQKDRQFTMIGATDLAEVSQWVETMRL